MQRAGRGRRLARRAALLLMLLLVGWLGSSALVARRLLRRSRPAFEEPVPEVTWARTHGLRLATGDGEDLGATWFEVAPGAPAVLLLHANGGCRSGMTAIARLWAELGWNALALTLRAHGDSSGTRNDFGRSARADVLAGVAWLEARSARRVVHGVSLGAAALCHASTQLAGRVQGYVLEAPYIDLENVLRNRTRLHLAPAPARIAELGLRAVAPLFLGELGRHSPLEEAHFHGAPLLLIAGEFDRRAPPADVGRFLDRAAGRGELVVLAAGHARACRRRPEEAQAALRGWLGRWMP